MLIAFREIVRWVTYTQVIIGHTLRISMNAFRENAIFKNLEIRRRRKNWTDVLFFFHYHNWPTRFQSKIMGGTLQSCFPLTINHNISDLTIPVCYYRNWLPFSVYFIIFSRLSMAIVGNCDSRPYTSQAALCLGADLAGSLSRRCVASMTDM